MMHEEHLAQYLTHGRISINSVSLSFPPALSTLTYLTKSKASSLSLSPLASMPWHSLSAYSSTLMSLVPAIACDVGSTLLLK